MVVGDEEEGIHVRVPGKLQAGEDGTEQIAEVGGTGRFDPCQDGFSKVHGQIQGCRRVRENPGEVPLI